MAKKRLTTKEVADWLGVCPQRIAAKLTQGHFPHHEWCECGRSILIPEEDMRRPENRAVINRNRG